MRDYNLLYYTLFPSLPFLLSLSLLIFLSIVKSDTVSCIYLQITTVQHHEALEPPLIGGAGSSLRS